jgi:hypothetical protein
MDSKQNDVYFGWKRTFVLLVLVDSRWIQSKGINCFTTVLQPSEEWQEPRDLPKYLPKYHIGTQVVKKRNIILKL